MFSLHRPVANLDHPFFQCNYFFPYFLDIVVDFPNYLDIVWVSTATATAVVLDQRGHSSSRSIWQQLAGEFSPKDQTFSPAIFFEANRAGEPQQRIKRGSQ